MTDQNNQPIQVFVVLNPVAGRTKPKEVRQALKQHLGGPGWEVNIYETTGEELVAGVVKSAVAEGADWVIASGGDGTVSGVVDGLVGTNVPMGILPAGTANVVAQELGLPLSIGKAVKCLTGRVRQQPMDAIKVDGSYYILAVGTGADAMAIKHTGRQEKRRFGPLAYVWSVIKVLFGLEAHRFTIVYDGQRKRVRAADILLANTGTLTGPLRWGRHIKPDDGVIDICVIRARNVFDFVLVAWDILWPGRQRFDRNVSYWEARESVSIQSERPVPMQGDGELIGQTPLQAEIISRAVQVLVPEEGEEMRRLPFLKS